MRANRNWGWELIQKTNINEKTETRHLNYRIQSKCLVSNPEVHLSAGREVLGGSGGGLT